MTLRSYIFVSCIKLWNWATDKCIQTKHLVADAYLHASHYLQYRYDTWIFPNDHTLPLPISHVSNHVPFKWMYSSHELQRIGIENPLDYYKLSWLSAKISIADGELEQEFDFDSFMNQFRVKTIPTIVPTLTMIFLTWCAETKQWFSANSKVHFHIIDDEGVESTLSLFADNNRLTIRNGKIYIRDYIVPPHDPFTFYHA
jgi:hypothetical protein